MTKDDLTINGVFQTDRLRKLFRKVRNIDISPEEATDLVLEVLKENYTFDENYIEECG